MSKFCRAVEAQLKMGSEKQLPGEFYHPFLCSSSLITKPLIGHNISLDRNPFRLNHLMVSLDFQNDRQTQREAERYQGADFSRR